MVDFAIIALIVLASICEAISDSWREDFQLYLESGKSPREWLKGRFWGYIPHNEKRLFPRDGWHLLKYPMLGSYMTAIALSGFFSINMHVFLLIFVMIVARFVTFELTLKLCRT